jgi:hypothetical protein
MAMKLFVFSMMFILTFFLLSCHDEIPVDFNNTMDPNSSSYIPEEPTTFPNPYLTADTGVSMSWIDRSSGEDGFVIERNIEYSVTYTVVDTVPANTTSYYHHVPLENLIVYRYRIKSYNRNGSRSYAGFDYCGFALWPPNQLRMTAPRFDSLVIEWTYTSQIGHQGFAVEQSINGSAFTLLATVGKDIRSFQNGAVDTLNDYAYRIQTLMPYNKSGYSRILLVKYGPQGWY